MSISTTWLGRLLGLGAGLGLFLLALPHSDGQPKPAVAEGRVPPFVRPKGYVCCRASKPLVIDGKLDDEAWRAVPWTDDFVDIEGAAKPRPRFRTRVKMLWDDNYFYIGAELEESHVWATLTQHDAVIFDDNDFEVFIDPNGDNHEYYEFEINALNTGWDLFLTKPYKDGGKAMNSWEIPGLKTAVHVNGALNDPSDTDAGWSVELAFPWKVLGEAAGMPSPPNDGDQWRVNFSRVEWQTNIVAGKYVKVKEKKEDNWVWSPQGVIDMHRPETWGYVQFSTAKPGDAKFRPDPSGYAKHLLHTVYYAQRTYHENNKRYATRLAELGLDGLKHESLAGPIRMQTTEGMYQVTAPVKSPEGKVHFVNIRQDALLWGD
jgi:hypothetical protein